MSLLIRAALLGGIAYLITRSLTGPSPQGRLPLSGGRSSARRDLHPGEDTLWPTSQTQERAAADAGPSS
jgi:hypothetical protein